MAAYIPVPRDLTRVKSKILFNLTKRQLLCFGAGALIGVPSFFLLKAGGNTSMASICMIIIMLSLSRNPVAQLGGNRVFSTYSGK